MQTFQPWAPTTIPIPALMAWVDKFRGASTLSVAELTNAAYAIFGYAGSVALPLSGPILMASPADKLSDAEAADLLQQAADMAQGKPSSRPALGRTNWLALLLKILVTLAPLLGG